MESQFSPQLQYFSPPDQQNSTGFKTSWQQHTISPSYPTFPRLSNHPHHHNKHPPLGTTFHTQYTSNQPQFNPLHGSFQDPPPIIPILDFDTQFQSNPGTTSMNEAPSAPQHRSPPNPPLDRTLFVSYSNLNRPFPHFHTDTEPILTTISPPWLKPQLNNPRHLMHRPSSSSLGPLFNLSRQPRSTIQLDPPQFRFEQSFDNDTLTNSPKR